MIKLIFTCEVLGNNKLQQITSLSKKFTEINFLKQYSSGKKHFVQAQLESINLEQKKIYDVELIKANLRNVNFENASLNQSDFRESSIANANFKFASINNVNFSHANLQDSKFSLAILTNVKFIGACLKNTSLYCAELKEVDFSYADLRSAYMSGIDLSEVNLQKAFYDTNTKFPPEFNPVQAGMIHEIDIESLDSLLSKFNHLGAISKQYLGNKMTTKYFHASRPDFDWLNIFNMNKSNQISFTEPVIEPIHPLQLYWLEKWMSSFTDSCSTIFRTFKSMI